MSFEVSRSPQWGFYKIWDDSIEVNIARLRDYKNKFVSHPSSASLDDATFKEYWEKTRSAIIVLGGQEYAPFINQLRNQRIDLKAQNRSQEFLEIQQSFQDLKDTFRKQALRSE
ncbi:uncharacterized protein LOC141891773 isoform X2 [Acropora palmata]|uniref:uncharacterized protein LOC141891773 isoform X2 n=1 Tax=Acropora palmata TaxID=6131 RepID=UPI003DA06658